MMRLIARGGAPKVGDVPEVCAFRKRCRFEKPWMVGGVISNHARRDPRIHPAWQKVGGRVPAPARPGGFVRDALQLYLHVMQKPGPGVPGCGERIVGLQIVDRGRWVVVSLGVKVFFSTQDREGAKVEAVRVGNACARASRLGDFALKRLIGN